MPLLTRWFIRTSLLYLIAALLVGGLLALRAVWRLPAVVAALGPVYFHLFLVGWVTQLIFGAIYWLFPREGGEPGYKRPGWAVYAMLNAGLLLRAVAEPLSVSGPGSVWGWLLTPSALLQWLAGVTFATIAWQRARPRGRR